jgi:thioredoxin-like negative regulator of GroEL
MLERLLLVTALAAAAVVLYRVYAGRHIRRASVAAHTGALVGEDCAGVPTIVYFSTPQCMPCKTQQDPALRQIEAELGTRVQVVRIDATAQPDEAERWGVFSSPTTFVLDPQGQAREVNYGVADAAKLRRQLEAVCPTILDRTVRDIDVA